MNSSSRTEMFSLSEIFPFWRGDRAAFVRPSLLTGIASMRATLAGARLVVLSVIVTHDYDGMFQDIGEMVPVEDKEAGIAVCHELLARRIEELLADNTSWTLIDAAVRPRSVMAATRIVVEGDPLPAHVCGSKVGNEPMYEAVYVRCYVCAADGSADPLPDFLRRLSGDSLIGLQDTLIEYLEKVGGR